MSLLCTGFLTCLLLCTFFYSLFRVPTLLSLFLGVLLDSSAQIPLCSLSSSFVLLSSSCLGLPRPAGLSFTIQVSHDMLLHIRTWTSTMCGSSSGHRATRLHSFHTTTSWLPWYALVRRAFGARIAHFVPGRRQHPARVRGHCRCGVAGFQGCTARFHARGFFGYARPPSTQHWLWIFARGLKIMLSRAYRQTSTTYDSKLPHM